MPFSEQTKPVEEYLRKEIVEAHLKLQEYASGKYRLTQEDIDDIEELGEDPDAVRLAEIEEISSLSQYWEQHKTLLKELENGNLEAVREFLAQEHARREAALQSLIDLNRIAQRETVPGLLEREHAALRELKGLLRLLSIAKL